MNIKEEIELAGIAVHRVATEESPKAKYMKKVAQLPPPPPKHRIAGPQDEDEAREAWRAFQEHIKVMHRDKTKDPFIEALESAGLIAGGKWTGTKLQAGAAAAMFADEFQGHGKRGKNGKEYDDDFQYLKQFTQYGIKPGTLKRYVKDFRDYRADKTTDGAKKYTLHEDEVKIVAEALINAVNRQS